MVAWIVGIVLFIGVLYVSKKITDMMQVPIDEVFRLRGLETNVRTGEMALFANEGEYVSSKDLILLQRPLFTVVGVGGVGPAYIPSLDIICITQAELERRRNGTGNATSH